MAKTWQGYSKKEEPTQFFDCKFYPYTAPGVDPLFAFVGGSEVRLAIQSLQDRSTNDHDI